MLATVWLFDGLLQLQPIMFTRRFASTMLAPTAHGNPGTVAHSITWAAGIIAHHSVPTDAAFAAMQIALGLGIAWRPTVKVTLAVSVVWALVVWWFGEGLGGVIAGTASTVSGAPGAVLIYAVLAVVLWPVDESRADGRSIATRAVGEVTAGVLWVVTWGALALFSVLGANRSPEGLHDAVRALGVGEPAWLASLDGHVAGVLAHRGLGVSVSIALVFAAVALGALAPRNAARALTVVAIVASVVIWIFGQNLGGVFSGSATDPDTGLLLVLLAVAYWPCASVVAPTSSPGPVRPRALEAV